MVVGGPPRRPGDCRLWPQGRVDGLARMTIDLSAALTFGILTATIAFTIWRPAGLNEGIGAAGGALAVLVLGTATPADVWRATAETAGVLIFLLAMMVVATIAEEAGCFDW